MQLVLVRWLCILLFCWIISSNNFFCGFKDFLCTRLYPLQTVLLLFSFCLIALARPSSPLLIRRGEIRHPCIVPHLEEKLLDFHHWVLCLLWIFNIWFLLCGGHFHNFYCVEWFYHKSVLTCQLLFLYQLKWSCGSYLYFGDVYTLHWFIFLYVEPSLLSRNKCYLVMVYMAFIIIFIFLIVQFTF